MLDLFVQQSCACQQIWFFLPLAFSEKKKWDGKDVIPQCSPQTIFILRPARFLITDGILSTTCMFSQVTESNHMLKNVLIRPHA